MTDSHLLHHNGITKSSLQKLNPLKTILDKKKNSYILDTQNQYKIAKHRAKISL